MLDWCCILCVQAANLISWFDQFYKKLHCLCNHAIITMQKTVWIYNIAGGALKRQSHQILHCILDSKNLISTFWRTTDGFYSFLLRSSRDNWNLIFILPVWKHLLIMQILLKPFQNLCSAYWFCCKSTSKFQQAACLLWIGFLKAVS
jgi:hypothetical protein